MGWAVLAVNIAAGVLSLLLPFPLSSAELKPTQSRDRRIVKKWSLSGRPSGLAIGPDGTIYAGLAETQSVVAIDPVKGQIIRETVLDSADIASTKELVTLRITADGSRLLVANGSDESATILSIPDLGVVREIGLEGEPVRDFLPDPLGRFVYVLGRKVHVYDFDGKREIRTLDVVDPMAIATTSQGSMLAVVASEEFVSGKATVAVLYDTDRFRELAREPLQTDRVIRSALFAADDQALVFAADDWLGEKLVLRKTSRTLDSSRGTARLTFEFGDLISSESICLPPGRGPQMLTIGKTPDEVIFPERRCATSGTFIGTARKVTTISLHGVTVFSLLYNRGADQLVATDPAGFLTIYRVPKRERK